VWLGGIATGQQFERHGRSSHPTIETVDDPGDQVPSRQ
jgi:hypothetical protein